jgi:hypothetical protein
VPFSQSEWDDEKRRTMDQAMIEQQTLLARTLASNKVLTQERRSAKKFFIASIVLRFL